MLFTTLAITAIAACVPAVFSGSVGQLDTAAESERVKLLDQLTTSNASEEIIADVLQYDDCVRDKTTLNHSEDSIGEECSMPIMESAIYGGDNGFGYVLPPSFFSPREWRCLGLESNVVSLSVEETDSCEKFCVHTIWWG